MSHAPVLQVCVYQIATVSPTRPSIAHASRKLHTASVDDQWAYQTPKFFSCLLTKLFVCLRLAVTGTMVPNF
jgi:hypothetical protein